MASSSILWLHCNNCGALPSERDNDTSRFSITTCGHVFCNECISMSVPCCFVCQQRPFYPHVIDNSLSPQIKSLFKPLHLIFENVWERVRNILVFQSAQFEISKELLRKKGDVSNSYRQDGNAGAETHPQLSAEFAYLKEQINDAQQLLAAVEEKRAVSDNISFHSTGFDKQVNRTYGNKGTEIGLSLNKNNKVGAGPHEVCSQYLIAENVSLESLPTETTVSECFPMRSSKRTLAKRPEAQTLVAGVSGKDTTVIRPSPLNDSVFSTKGTDRTGLTEVENLNDQRAEAANSVSDVKELNDSKANRNEIRRHSRRLRLAENPYVILSSLKKLNIPVSEAQHEALRHMRIPWTRAHHSHSLAIIRRCNTTADF